jgi:hypothetical protein
MLWALHQVRRCPTHLSIRRDLIRTEVTFRFSRSCARVLDRLSWRFNAAKSLWAA